MPEELVPGGDAERQKKAVLGQGRKGLVSVISHGKNCGLVVREGSSSGQKANQEVPIRLEKNTGGVRAKTIRSTQKKKSN